MKIVLCGSMAFAEKIVYLEKELVSIGHEPYLNKLVKSYLDLKEEKLKQETSKNKSKYDLIKVYFEEIKKADAILVINEEKKGIGGYIGGNVFLEMGFAHVLDKKIFLLNEIPEVSFKDEIVAMNPVVLNGNLSLIQ